MYEYIPSLLGDTVPPYDGYKADVHPGISHVFQSAAFRYVGACLFFKAADLYSYLVWDSNNVLKYNV